MANDDPERREPSLEPPSLGFSLRRRKQRPAADDQPTRTLPPAPTAPPAAATDEPTTVLPAAPSDPAPAPGPAAPPLFADEVEEQPRRGRLRRPRGSTDPSGGVTAVSEQPPAPESPAEQVEPHQPAASRAPRPPLVTGMAAAVATGVLVGLLLVGATWGLMRLCEVVRGTSSCGDPGFFLLLALLVAAVLVGAVLLRAFTVPDPASTSFLAVGLLTVVALVFLVDVLFAWSMVIVIPVCAAATYALAYWVTATFIEPADR